MLIYNSDKPPRLFSSIKILTLEIALLYLAALILEILNMQIKLLNEFIIPGAIVFIKFIYSLHEEKPDQLIIDNTRREVRASFRSPLNDEHQVVLPFDICRVRVERYRSFFSRKKKTEIIFYKNKSRQFELSSRETGFAETTLENLGEELDRLTHEAGK